MGEVVRITTNYDNGGGGDDDMISDWEAGLPGGDDLTPLSQALITPDLASAFGISPEPSRSMRDVNRESQRTLTSIHGGNSYHSQVLEEIDVTREGSDSRKVPRMMEATEEVAESSAAGKNDENCEEDLSPRTLKKPRLVWTPQLHKRFVDVVDHLGIKNAVPKTIMQMMNVEGLTRENVASHLQKYRLYLKRTQQGLSKEEGSSSLDHLFTSTPVPQSLHDSAGGGSGRAASNGHVGLPIQMPYKAPAPMMSRGGFNGYEAHHHYHHHQFGGVAPYHHHVAPNN